MKVFWFMCKMINLEYLYFPISKILLKFIEKMAEFKSILLLIFDYKRNWENILMREKFSVNPKPFSPKAETTSNESQIIASIVCKQKKSFLSSLYIKYWNIGLKSILNMCQIDSYYIKNGKNANKYLILNSFE